MARLRGELKAALLRTLWRGAKRQGVALQDALEAFQDQGYDSVKQGRPLNATSGGGYSVSFDPPSFGDEITRTEFLSFSEELFDIYADAQATATTNNVTLDSDAMVASDQLFTIMMADDRMNSCREIRQDSTMLRWPSISSRG